MFNAVDPDFNTVFKWSDVTRWLNIEAESLTLDDRLSCLRMSAKVLQSVCSPAPVIVPCSAIPAGEDLTVAEQLEEVLRVRRVRIFNRIVKPNLRARVGWDVARGD